MIGTCRDITDDVRRDHALHFYADVFAHARIGLSAWVLGKSHSPMQLRLAAFNAATEGITGVALDGRIGAAFDDLFPFVDQAVVASARTILGDPSSGSGEPMMAVETQIGDRTVSATMFALSGPHIGLALEDITAAKRAQALAAGEQRALEMLASGASIADILDGLVRVIEETVGGVIGSILLVDETGTRLQHTRGTAPTRDPWRCRRRTRARS